MRFKTAVIALFLSIHLGQAQQPFETFEHPIKGTSAAIKFAPVAGGSFQMGSNDKDKGREADEMPAKMVAVDSFWMAIYETTYDQYAPFLDEERDGAPKPDGITRPSPPYIDFTLGMGKEGGFPANSMQQYAALMYCKWLYGKTGVFYRLPTEAEWEYAAKGGKTGNFDSKTLKETAWSVKNSGGHYHKVGELKPNALGIYDLLGNVAEWTLDEYRTDYFKIISETDPSVKPTKRHPRTVRGGSFKEKESDLRPANRLESDPIWNRRDPQIPKSKWWNADAPFVGFRLVRPVKQPTQAEVEAFFALHLQDW
jgi:formylglycine-generating enzyme required for sulfatase activity